MGYGGGRRPVCGDVLLGQLLDCDGAVCESDDGHCQRRGGAFAGAFVMWHALLCAVIEKMVVLVCLTAFLGAVLLCCVGLCCVVLCCVVLCWVGLCCVVLCCVVLCCVVLCCVVLCCVVLSCVVLRCVVLRCIVLCDVMRGSDFGGHIRFRAERQQTVLSQPLTAASAHPNGGHSLQRLCLCLCLCLCFIEERCEWQWQWQ